MGSIRPATRKLDHRFQVEGETDLDRPEVWPEVDALLIKNSEELTALLARLATLVIKDIVEESLQLERPGEDAHDLASSLDQASGRTHALVPGTSARRPALSHGRVTRNRN